MVKQKIIGLLVVLCAVLWGCSSSKNTAGTRWYHGFNVRYNVFFNGQSAFNEALKNQQKTFQGNDSAMIMFPVDALPREKPTKGGPFDKVIEKSAKAIQQHSISAKPKREEGRRNDPLYKEWMARTEYNPVLHRAWMLMAKAQFHNGDFLEAAGTFAYVVRIYRTQPEIYTDALIWQAMSYTNMGWFVEAEELLAKAKRGGLPNKQMEDWHATAYADLLIQQKKYKEAIPYLNTALKAEKNGWQKKHDRQLLAQLQNAKVDNTSKTDTDTLYIPSDDNKLATYQRLKMLPVIEDSLYGDAFEAYLQGYSQLKRDASLYFFC
ncbi:hypothetical protein AGMMS49965_26010 [Bacteroidia bacterium]|nr:hypothetical protein AGMMS49965_26010 [Bacteroidia bacterium]